MTDSFHEYHQDNRAELTELVTLGVISNSIKNKALAHLSVGFESYRHMSLTERTDLACDLARIGWPVAGEVA